MKVQLKLFARARDLAGADQLEFDLPADARVAELRAALIERVDAMRPLAGHLLFAIGTDYAGDEASLSDEQEVACFPPVSGG